jgi:hypothetical protein
MPVSTTSTSSVRRLAWAFLLVGGLVLMVAGIAGWPTVGDVSLGPFSVVVGIALVIGDAVMVARASD